MTVRQSVAVMAVAGAVTLAGCGGNAKSVNAGSARPTTTSTTTARPGSTAQTVTLPPGTLTTAPPGSSTTTAGPKGSGAPVVQLTAASQGPVTVSVGATIELTLSGPDMKWSGVMVNPAGLLQAAPSPAPPPYGQLVIWTAVAPGTAKVTSGETPICAAGTLCPQLIRLFELTIVIT